MWLLLGTAAIVTAMMNIVTRLKGKDEGVFRFASLSLSALTMCAFYSDGAGRVAAQDWGGLMDTMPAMSTALWVCVIASILINGVTLFAGRK